MDESKLSAAQQSDILITKWITGLIESVVFIICLTVVTCECIGQGHTWFCDVIQAFTTADITR